MENMSLSSPVVEKVIPPSNATIWFPDPPTANYTIRNSTAANSTSGISKRTNPFTPNFTPGNLPPPNPAPPAFEPSTLGRTFDPNAANNVGQLWQNPLAAVEQKVSSQPPGVVLSECESFAWLGETGNVRLYLIDSGANIHSTVSASVSLLIFR